MVSRVYVEKKPGFDVEAQQLAHELRDILGIERLEGLRLVNRYDVEGITGELFAQCVPTVFSEPQSDVATLEMPAAEGAAVFAVEYLPGQFDQRADSASECIQLISQGERPEVRSAKVYLLEGPLADEDVAAIKHYVINPIEAREASLEPRETLRMEQPVPPMVETVEGFLDLDEAGLAAFIADRGLAMDLADLAFCQRYFAEEGRNPTITEIKMIDTYWSDHCRHTTFGTVLDDVRIDDEAVRAAFEKYLAMRHELGRDEKPVCLMDMGTIGARWLKAKGILTGLDESEEINACTVKVKVDVDGEEQDWLYLFKNETHNHPTEIEPFGGAATCVGGAIRDPLSGRSYVYQAMRLTGAADPLVPVSETLPGKLPQRKLVTTAAAGYSSYGNQIGLATGQVNELYHPGYAAKRMEIGAVVGATPADHVRRETPAPGDVIVLLGGRTGRDGIGGATGSSKAHKLESLETCGAEVQKGNAPVERKIQRLFRRGDACRMIKRCNDFGAGGVSVAVGELADGLFIDLNKVPKKYEGLDGTELAIAESQERMAVALAPEDVDAFIALAHEENLEATPIAEVTEEARVRMEWNGATIVDVSRDFLNSNGAAKHQDVHVAPGGSYERTWEGETLAERLGALVRDLNVCSNKGLSERFDSTIGAATALMPFGGARQLTPAMAMVAKLPVFGETSTVSGMAWGFNPYLTAANPFVGSYVAVVESVAKLTAAGFAREDMYLTFQEYFEKLRDEPERWGKPAAAVLGALMAQVDLGVGAIGGKDSMSGSFEQLDVPPTLVSFATAVGSIDRVTSPEFKGAGHRVARIAPAAYDGVVPEAAGLLEAIAVAERLIGEGAALAVSTPGYGGTAEALFKMCVGNGIGLTLDEAVTADELFAPAYGSFLVELADDSAVPVVGDAVRVDVLGETTEAYQFAACGETISLANLQEAWESQLEPVFPYRAEGERVEPVSFGSATPLTYNGTIARPRVVIPVFPGNNCEYDSARAFEQAGAVVDTFVINNLTPDKVAESTAELVRLINNSQIIMLPGGFSGGDEPDGSAKFITAFFRAPAVTEAVRDLLQNRDGLMLGICNGFQALVKLGLVPFGDIRPMDETCPTLTFNNIGRHQSRLVRTRVASSLSPWLSRCEVGDVHTVPVSHGEGRFVASDELLAQLRDAGQIATQYVGADGQPSMDLGVNPNGSAWAVEGITSPDGRVLGKMGHSERRGAGLYQNVPGDLFQPLFEGGVGYFTD
ncbi:phosphoribosylformylglycinamidine synthase [Gordonibacter urolithinfaciens]|uniref:Phosphoribosylformylglycinamidine synthase n=1 Tax=Gordonibacter urolithinfaciens TaxID=1335613 RepID=A0A6N8ID99_9ACTN|nr:phosphoribosylformylglycinamidine synthase [Gordonibacter urolithinfaciens]MVM53377.1 phosphoribosylformylglycinamidine synthase [Gordonibacter urolithinfaciens]MVN13775.1 phosphoribosylformylglycinamidine synthase [Gordonibacter urolithinfaciens]MVN37413.1 phosphoribosylformylglycinamidine synthase [Gordonibacter urolithinfaciens]MVN54749.1 phosphoribosylformylglycinamidine synthase [Gordonibacter urolithinfaciens]MVN60035.1 phosphoribosylformylglycinamidine synthase [Gordonibacter urolith